MCAKYSLHSLNRFDLAIQLSELQIAYEIASESEVGLLYGVFFFAFCTLRPFRLSFRVSECNKRSWALN